MAEKGPNFMDLEAFIITLVRMYRSEKQGPQIMAHTLRVGKSKPLEYPNFSKAPKFKEGHKPN